MAKQLSLNFQESIDRKNEGMDRVADNAENHVSGRQDHALYYLKKYPFTTFQAEDVRVWAYQNGLEQPPHCRAWGAVIATAKRQGLIFHAGFESVSNPKAHRTPASVWSKIR